ncbi:fatty-acid amide hydrolase 2-like isoform X5 [Pectinophora gossypiella]|uniref:fatty-acid amide hydrolase 2-like isoform X2 n=1 Tax=Pectinophora gossypiella TaxID=13191 RepID=UPI00214E3A61|nr:fatty-acid amide hydrolase 2-like isoform X2 [Pectinophora gossypiella]XP_049876082.1 fatty-acid amide hydrolase 2-like isoform X3 [Pectinophora gossypiella]XP_049876083.1 fatty-acid amide hydrolase 2-like isoform X4 [Pectinophora gossypiella]XP_049876084.1 fatty-acid amide hydrolase 2-like isoform X5 [Pectinophora gossypiella]
MKTFLCYLRIILDKMIDYVFSLYWEKKKEKVPDLDEKYAFLADSATTLAKKIRDKQLKSEDLVRAVIERIKQVNPIINAVAEDRYLAALDEAREVDRMIEAGLSEEEARKKPFLGVPFTTKESQALKGMKYTMGLWRRRREVAAEDSEAVVRLKVAGAIPIATTNLPELLIWQETRNPVYGMTNNPHHSGRTPGGSSGAEAALTATYASTISLCSDVGGSTRMPAFYCGMFGYHPTAGATNLRGVFFRKGGEESMFALGFISKHVEDLAPLMTVVAGDKAASLKLDRDVNVKDIKFYYMEGSKDCLVSPLSPGMTAAMNRVVTKISQDLTSTGSGPEKYHHEGLDHMYRLWYHWMSKEPDNYASLYNNGGSEAKGWVELCKKLVGLSNHCFFTIMRLLELQMMPQVDAAWAEELSAKLKQDIYAKLGDSGVLLMPSAPYAAPYHYTSVLRPYNFAYWAIVNVLKCPAVQVPLGVNSQGLPIGIQVVAAPNNDGLCLAVAKYLEKEFGGAVMACRIKAK